MDYYGIFLKNSSIIQRWISVDDSAEVLIKENEELCTLTKEQAEIIGSNKSTFELDEEGNVTLKEIIQDTASTETIVPSLEERVATAEAAINLLLGL